MTDKLLRTFPNDPMPAYIEKGEGIYLYTDNDIVIFEFGDAILEIPMSEIKVLSLG